MNPSTAHLSDNSSALFADRDRLEQVLINLLSNAMRHTPEGGTVTMEAVQRDEVHLQLSVCDTGSGLSEGDRAHVFDRFYRADKSRSRGSGGTGLGLPSAMAIVDAHGRAIWAENDPNRGACFRFRLRSRVKHDADGSSHSA